MNIQNFPLGLPSSVRKQAPQPAVTVPVRTGEALSPAPSAAMKDMAARNDMAIKNMILFGAKGVANKPAATPQKLTYAHARTIRDSVLGDIEVYKYSNGMKLYAVKKDDVPLVSYGELIKTGSANETYKTNGASHFLEHLVFKGTKKLPGDVAAKAFASIGASINAFTWLDETFYYVQNTPKESLPQAIALWAELLSDPEIPQEAMDAERFVVISEIDKSNQDPSDAASRKLAEKVWPTSRGKWETLGPKRNIQNISRDEIRRFISHYYDPANRAIVVVGDFDLKETLDAVAKEHERPFNARQSFRPQKPLKAGNVRKESIMRKDIQQGSLLMGFDGPRPEDPDYERQLAALQVLSVILGQGQSSRLNRTLVEETQLADRIGMGVNAHKRDSMIRLSAQAEPAQLKTIQEKIRTSLADVAANGVNERELKKAVTLLKQALAGQTEEQSEMMAELAIAISHGRLEHSFGNRLDRYLAKVTADDVKAVTRRFLNPEAERSVLLVPEDYKARKGRVRKAPQFSGSLGPKDRSVTLPGGTEVLTRTKPRSLNTTVTLHLKGGNRLDPQKGAMLALADLLQRGTVTKSATQIQEELEENGVAFGTDSDGDGLYLTFSALSENKAAMLKLMAEILNRPGMRADDLNFVKKDMRSRHQQTEDYRPATVAARMLTEALHGAENPYATSRVQKAVMDNLDRLGVETLDTLRKRVFTAPNLTVAGAGDITQDELVAATENLVRDWPTHPVDVPPVMAKPLTQSRLMTQAREGLSQAEVFRGWHAPGVHHPDRPALALLNFMLGGGLNSRLFNTFRELPKEPLCYSTYTSYTPQDQGGSFRFYIGTYPDKIRLVTDMFQEEVRKLTDELAPEEEVQQARLQYKSLLLASMQTTANISSHLSEHRALGKDSVDDLIPKLMAVTPEQVQAVAKKYLARPSVITVVAPKAALEAQHLPVNGETGLDY